MAARKILGTTVDFGPAVRDLFLAGGFSALVMWAATERFPFLFVGFLSGAILGVVLHVLPPDPQPGDDKRGRIIVRAISGALAGLWLAPGIAWLASGVVVDAGEVPTGAEFAQTALLGMLAGAAWYTAWGFWETRNGTSPT